MKQAKFSLTAVAFCAVIGGALAFKASRQLDEFYAYTTTRKAGEVTGACIPTVLMSYQADVFGTITPAVSSVQITGVTTCTVRAVKVQ